MRKRSKGHRVRPSWTGKISIVFHEQNSSTSSSSSSPSLQPYEAMFDEFNGCTKRHVRPVGQFHTSLVGWLRKNKKRKKAKERIKTEWSTMRPLATFSILIFFNFFSSCFFIVRQIDKAPFSSSLPPRCSFLLVAPFSVLPPRRSLLLVTDSSLLLLPPRHFFLLLASSFHLPTDSFRKQRLPLPSI